MPGLFLSLVVVSHLGKKLPGLRTVQSDTSYPLQDAAVRGHLFIVFEELAGGLVLQEDQRRVLLIAEDLERAIDHATSTCGDRNHSNGALHPVTEEQQVQHL